MALTAHRKILDEIGARLANISVANGYTSDIVKIQRMTLTAFDSERVPEIRYWQETDSVTANEYGGDRHSLAVTVQVVDFIRDEDGYLSDKASSIAGDVVTGLFRTTGTPLVSDSNSGRLGDLVVGFQHVATVYQIGEGQTPFLDVRIGFDVFYDAPRGDPYTIEVDP